MKKIINKIFNVDTLIMPSDVEFMKIDSDSVYFHNTDCPALNFIICVLIWVLQRPQRVTFLSVFAFDEADALCRPGASPRCALLLCARRPLGDDTYVIINDVCAALWC
jgi:hypothetical protein